MKLKLKPLAALLLVGVTTFSLSINAEENKSQILFKNANIFDGKTNKLIKGKDVLVEGKMIKTIAPSIKAADAQVIDAAGRTLMPGLIDNHVHHTIYTPINRNARANLTPFLAATIATKKSEAYLLRGFTTVRDTGGQSMFIHRAIEAGQIDGPRTYGSGPILTQTSGHGDFRDRNTRHPNMSGVGAQHWYEQYNSYIVDGVDEVTRASREILMKDATLLKMTVSGGVSSEFDPVHMEQFFEEEIHAAVRVAEQWGTYVTVHVFSSKGVNTALDAGVKGVEHVPFIDEKTVKRLKKEGIFVETNNALVLSRPLDVAKASMPEESYSKLITAIAGIKKVLPLLAKHDAKMVYGSDMVAEWDKTIESEEIYQLKDIPVMKEYGFSDIQILRSITSNGGEYLKLLGKNNPWPKGDIGVIKEGAYADILLVDGDPVKDVLVISDDKNFDIIMKDGKVYKNTL